MCNEVGFNVVAFRGIESRSSNSSICGYIRTSTYLISEEKKKKKEKSKKEKRKKRLVYLEYKPNR